MKIRVTLMTENNKHLNMPDDKVNALALKAWELAAALLDSVKEDPDERIKVESVEVVEK